MQMTGDAALPSLSHSAEAIVVYTFKPVPAAVVAVQPLAVMAAPHFPHEHSFQFILRVFVKATATATICLTVHVLASLSLFQALSHMSVERGPSASLICVG